MTVRGRDDIKSAYRDESRAGAYIATRFDDPLGAELHRRQVQLINRAVRQVQPGAMLEIACGPARLTPELEYVRTSVAVEQSPSMLLHARERLQELGRTHWRLVQGDAFELPFPDKSFDMVVTYRFLRHFDRADRGRLLREIRRVLRPRGGLIFDVAHASAYKWLLGKWGVAGSWVDDYWFERDEFVAEMRDEQLQVETLHAVHSLLHVQHYLFSYVHPRLPWLATPISRAMTALCPWDAYEWVAMCRSGS